MTSQIERRLEDGGRLFECGGGGMANWPWPGEQKLGRSPARMYPPSVPNHLLQHLGDTLH